MSFGVDESFFGFPQLLLEMADPSMERAQVFLSREVQAARHRLEASIDRPFDSAAQTQSTDRCRLHPRVLHQLCESRVLHRLEKSIFQGAHRRSFFAVTR
jgi:hypothetical protein